MINKVVWWVRDKDSKYYGSYLDPQENVRYFDNSVNDYSTSSLYMNLNFHLTMYVNSIDRKMFLFLEDLCASQDKNNLLVALEIIKKLK